MSILRCYPLWTNSSMSMRLISYINFNIKLGYQFEITLKLRRIICSWSCFFQTSYKPISYFSFGHFLEVTCLDIYLLNRLARYEFLLYYQIVAYIVCNFLYSLSLSLYIFGYNRLMCQICVWNNFTWYIYF